MDEGCRKDGEWALNIKSVVVFGRIRIVEEEEKKREICTNLVRKFTDDQAYLQREQDLPGEQAGRNRRRGDWGGNPAPPTFDSSDQHETVRWQ
jgi:hypothetical protein